MFVKAAFTSLKLFIAFAPFVAWLFGIIWASEQKYDHPDSAKLYNALMLAFTGMLALAALWIHSELGFWILTPY